MSEEGYQSQTRMNQNSMVDLREGCMVRQGAALVLRQLTRGGTRGQPTHRKSLCLDDKSKRNGGHVCMGRPYPLGYRPKHATMAMHAWRGMDRL